MTALTLAKAILATAAAREESFNHAKAAEIGTSHNSLKASMNCYELSISEAANLHGGEFATPAYLMLECAWNDALDWANAEMLKEPKADPLRLLEAGVKIVDSILPQAGKIVIDVFEVNEFLMGARPLVEGK